MTSTIPGPGRQRAGADRLPDEPAGVYLHIHGGGWTLGGADQQDQLLTTLAEEARGRRRERRVPARARRSRFPAGADDCEAAACWLVENSVERFGTARLVIGGESAGAHLSALTLLRLRDRHGAAGSFQRREPRLWRLRSCPSPRAPATGGSAT